MKKRPIQQGDITIVNIYASNIRGPKYIKQILVNIKGETGSNKITKGVFNTPLTSMHRSPKQKITKETPSRTHEDKLNRYIHRLFHSKSVKYIFFSSAPGTFS